MQNITNEAGAIKVPRHLAIIMDGNGRWAESRGLQRISGHREGARAVTRTIEYAAASGVKILTLFAFSSENWRRPQLEVSALMALFSMTLSREASKLKGNGIKTKILGDVSRFSKKLQYQIAEVQDLTSDCTRMSLNIAANYGGRWDILQACKKITRQTLEGNLNLNELSESLFCRNLSVGDDVDLLIRTGGEKRISNFLLWQCAYSELCFSDTLWPDFSENDLKAAFEFFSSRERRFGMTSEQIRRNV